MEYPWYKQYAPGVPHTVEVSEGPIYQLFDESVAKFPKHVAIDFLGYEMSYSQLDDAVNRFANGLQKIGVNPGDRVALMLPNSPQMVIGFFAVNKIGGVIVNVNPLYTAHELHHQLNDAGAETLVMLDRFFPVYREIASDVTVKRIVVTGIQDYLPFPKNLLYPLLARIKKEWVDVKIEQNIYRFKHLLERYGPEPEYVEIRGEDLALLQYTGGTTGVSKGAMLSNRNIVSNILMVRSWDRGLKDGKDCFLLVIPFFHVYGMTVGMGTAVQSAAKMVLLPRFETRSVLEAIDKHKPTMFPGIPTMYVAVNNYPGVSKYDLSSIRTCISGAAPLPAEVKARFEELSGAELVEGYGLTEASPVTHANPIGGKNITGAIGLPLPGVEAKVVDEQGQDLPVGEIGEIAVKGPNVMMGYWQRPEETANVIKDGWLLTGDMARVDEEGYFYIADRKKDMIVASGYNIYPREIEEVLYTHPAIQEAAVIGVPDAYRGETVKAFVTLKADTSATAEDIIGFCKERLAVYKVPKQLEFRDNLPKSLVGKILRRELAKEEKEKLEPSA